ncbi:MAG: hypothetical protein NTY53_02250, partial [Kiritimatiellaeota bacterium]|nr:hypothetical protein [Kiritimatiellota bacterium]
MRKIFLIMAGGACALWLAGCGGAPGERDYKAGVREYERGNFARAMTHFEKAGHQPGGEALAALQAAGGNASAAVAQLLPMATRETARSEPLELLGQIYLDRQSWPEARRALSEAAQRAPGSPRVLTRFALAELGAGDERSAIALLTRALDHDGQYAPALFNLAMIYHQNHGDRVQTTALLRRFVEAAPKAENVDYARQLLADLSNAATPPVPPTSGVRPPVRPAVTSTPVRVEQA